LLSPATPLLPRWPLAIAFLALSCAEGAHGTVAQIVDRHGNVVSQAGVPLVYLQVAEAGVEPRAPLRYRLHAGQSETLVMELASEMKLAIGDLSPPPVRSPALRVTIEVRATAVRPRITLEGKLVKLEIPDDPAVAAPVVKAVRSDLDRLAGTAWKAVFSDQGMIELLALPDPKDANTQVMTTLERIRESLRLLLPPLPDVPIGNNARWQVRHRGTVGAARVDETVIYKLASGNEHSQLLATMGMSARQQPLIVPGMPPGANLTLGSFEGGGKGQVDFALTSIVQPSTMRWSAIGRGIALPAGEPPTPFTMTVDASVIVRRP